MLHFQRILAGLILSVLIGGIACWRGSLTRGGWAGAIVTGTLTFGFGSWTLGMPLIVFFVSSSLLSRFRSAYKQRLAGEKFEKGSRRDLAQALANGGAAAALALGYGLSDAPHVLLAMFAGSMATVTADTWATESGVLSRRSPRLITTLRVVAPGTSGGITPAGTLAAAAGAFLIGLTMLVVTWLETGRWLPWLLPAALVGGLIGSLADSVLGATVQAMYRSPQGSETERSHARDGTPHTFARGWRWMNNDAVNFLSSLVGGGCGVVLFLVASRL